MVECLIKGHNGMAPIEEGRLKEIVSLNNSH